MVNGNSGWPESFGFSIAGDAPVVVVAVLENSVAQNYGLNVGDQILEINDKNVRGLSKEQVTLVARRSKQVPPSLSVISRIRTFRMKRRRHVRFGMTLRGSKPVYVQSVTKNSPAYEAGICPGDMFVKINGKSVKRLDKKQVNMMIERTGNSIKLMMIAGNYAIQKFEDRFSSNSLSKYKRSREFFVKMNYYLTGEEHKKTLLIALLKRYARDRDIERFSRLLSSLLTSDVQRRLLKPVRYYIPARHQPYFDAIVNQNYARGASDLDSPRISDENSPREQATRQNGKLPRISPRDRPGLQNWQSSSTPFARNDNTPLGSWSKANGKSKSKVFPCRLVNLRRETGNSSFGFTISGCKPVFIRSVDNDGPAVVAELKPGDCIIEINGINVRNAVHESVIELLKNSGTFPTLMVQWRPLPENIEISPIRPRGQSDGSERRQNLLESNSFADSALEIDISPRNGYPENQDQTGLNASQESYQPELVKHLKEQMKKLLTRGEQLVVKQALAFFHSDRNVSKLVEALEPVLDDPLKLQMLHCISRLLPGPAQLEFEKQAVDMVARQMENGIIISATTNDHEIFDILFRVQGSKLAETDRPRNLIGGLLDVNADSSWPSSKGVSISNSTGSLGSDLDQSPSRDNARENGILELKETPIKDSTFDALMSIDEERLLQDSNHDRNSTVITTAVVHSTPSQRKSSLLKKNGGKGRHSDSNNNNDDVFIEEQSGEYATIIDEEEMFNSELRHPSQKDIDDLKQELLLAQEEARKAQKEAEEKGLLLENQVPGVSSSRTANGPTSIADAIKERSFDMEADKVRSASTDDHVILPGQFPPPGAMPPPPPPPPPAPPAPPPPPGGPGMNAMQLKRINWEKVSGLAIENTVWGKLGSEDEVDGIIDFMELEQLFGTKKIPVKEKKVEKKQTSILESKKTYNLSILLAHLKMPVNELHNAVLSIDETKLTEPHIRTLLMCAPEGSETEAFKSFKGEPSSMSTADAFTVKMMSVANYNERLRAMLFKARFHDRVTEIEPDIKSVSLASEEVKSSKKLMKILEIVLATGNYMNKGSTTMSGASGFKISFLTKLISTKTSDNKSTLLHVIVNTIKNNKSELLDVKDELANVPLAAKVSSQMLSLEISELRTGMKEINDELKNYAVKEGDNDRYKDVIGKFVKDAEKQFEDLLDSYNKMKNAFSLTTEFYSESKITTEDFFGAFAVFLQHLENVKKDVMSEEEKKEYQARKERELQEIRKRRNSTASRGRSLSNTSQPSDSEIKMGFDAVMRKRSLSQGNREGATNGVSVTEFATKNSDESTIEETVILPQTESRVDAAMDMDISRGGARSLSVTSNNTDVALVRSTRTGETVSAENREKQLAVKGSPDAIRVLPQGEPNAFAKLLKRRERIEDTDSELERADSSASDMSFFSTLPRAKFKPPPALSKKKRPAPPPLKPKPRQGSIDFKSMTLPRSLSKTSSDERYDSEASKGSSSGGSFRNVSEQGNISERTWSLSSAGSARNGVADAVSKSEINGKKIEPIAENEIAKIRNSSGTGSKGSRINGSKNNVPQSNGAADAVSKSEINGKKIEPIAENEIAKIRNSSGTGSKGSRINGSKNNVPQSKGALETDSLAQKETTGQDVTEDRKKGDSLVNEPIQKQTFNSSPTSNQLVVNLGPNQPTYNVDVISSDSESRSRATSNSVKPAKPARKSTDPFKIISYELLDSVKKPDVNGYHDSDDYDNLPPEKTAEAKMVAEEDDEPDYALPTFATDQRPEMNKNKRFEEANSSTDLKEGNHYDSLNLNNLEINNKNRENLSDNETSDGDQYSQKNKNLNNKLTRGNLFRNSSLSSSQSSESDSPKSYRKYKQNRLSTSKNKSSTMQKLKGVINGMRSRSSSEASTTSIEPVSGKNKRQNASLKMSPRPILKKYNQSPEHSLDIGTLDRSHSPHTVTFQDLPSASQDVMKLSTDDESLPDVSFKIPPMPKMVPPMPPPDSVPPPMPPPYHLRKDSLSLEPQSSEEVNNKRVISTLNVEITSPPPPPFKPPPPPQKANKLTTPDELSPLSPTLPQFKPPPPPFLSKMKTATSSAKRPLPPTPPTERPPLKEALHSSPKQVGKDLEAKLNVTYKKPPPPPKRIESIKPPPPPPVRTVSPSSPPPIVESQSLGITASVSPANTASPSSSAALIRKTMSSMSARSPSEGGSESSRNISSLSCDIDAEFDKYDTIAKFPVSAESPLEYPSPAPEVFTAPLDDIPIVPPPPASPPKAPYSSELLEEGNKRNDQSDQEQTESRRMKTLAKPNFMIKVLPTTPPLPFRENETGDSSGHTTDDTGSSPTTQQLTPDGSETQVRANRTDSVSSVGSISFPPLPPSSLLDTVEEDDGRYHTVFQF